MNEVLLTVCIPTYNRKDMLFDRIKEVLKYNHNDLEIVVLDNCSTDATKEVIENIKDKRVKYFRNEKPLPPSSNWIESYKYANGKYAYHLNDRDHLNGDLLYGLMDVLRKNSDISCGYCGYKEKINVGVFRGSASRKNIPFCGYHVSGVLVNIRILREMFSIEQYQYRSVQGQPNVEPHIILLYDLSTVGAWLSYDSPMSYNANHEEINSVSGVIYGKNNNLKGKMWFEPPYLYDLFLEVVGRVLQDNQLNNREKREVIEIGLKTLLKACTTEYGIYILSDLHRKRYGVSRYYISFFELEKIMINILKQFKNDMANQDDLKFSMGFYGVIPVSIMRIIKFKLQNAKRIIENNVLFKQENRLI